MLRFFRRFYFGNYHLSVLLMKIQHIQGMTNEVIGEKDKHYIFWDIEGCSLEQAIETLMDVQYEYQLADIFIVSDKEGSYRAWCFSKRTFNETMQILLATKYVDHAYLLWTFRRHKATLRTSKKIGRPEQDVVILLRGYESYELPARYIHAIYETGLEKYPKLKVLKLW